MSFERVASLGDITDGGLLGVKLSNGEAVCLSRKGDEVFAMEDCCSHAEYQMSVGSMVGDYEVECVLHGATFDVRSGEALTPPADCPIRTFQVKVDGDDVLVGPENK